MTNRQPRIELYDQFATTAREYGIEPQRVPPERVEETIATLVEPPAVGVPLPWDGVSLPDSVQRNPTAPTLEAAVTGVTDAALGVADYGSVVLRANEHGSEPISLFTDLHVVVLHQEGLVPDMETAFEWFGDELRDTRDSAIIATGPSATADMGALVQGAHGPKDVEIVVIA